MGEKGTDIIPSRQRYSYCILSDFAAPRSKIRIWLNTGWHWAQRTLRYFGINLFYIEAGAGSASTQPEWEISREWEWFSSAQTKPVRMPKRDLARSGILMVSKECWDAWRRAELVSGTEEWWRVANEFWSAIIDYDVAAELYGWKPLWEGGDLLWFFLRVCHSHASGAGLMMAVSGCFPLSLPSSRLLTQLPVGEVRSLWIRTSTRWLLSRMSAAKAHSSGQTQSCPRDAHSKPH